MIRKFIYWWKNPTQRTPKKKEEKPLTWRQEMESRRLGIIKEAKNEEKKRRIGNKETANPYVIMIGIGIAFYFGITALGVVVTNKEHSRYLNECEELGWKYTVVDRDRKASYVYPYVASSQVVDIYGCVK